MAELQARASRPGMTGPYEVARYVFLVRAKFTIRSNLREARGDYINFSHGRDGHATKIRLVRNFHGGMSPWHGRPAGGEYINSLMAGTAMPRLADLGGMRL